MSQTDAKSRYLRGFAITALTFVAVILLALAGPQGLRWLLDRAREAPKRPAESSRLQHIGMALRMYRLDYRQFPATLEQLYPGYLSNAENFVSPNDRSPHEGAGGLRISFVYVGNLPKGIPDPVIICYTRKGVHDEGRNMLRADNAVWWLEEGPAAEPGQSARIRLRESYDAVVAAYGQGLTPERDAELRKFYEIND